MQGRLSAKVDVFSFGVLVLELISGQRNSSFGSYFEAENLTDWVRFSWRWLIIIKINASTQILDVESTDWVIYFNCHSYSFRVFRTRP